MKVLGKLSVLGRPTYFDNRRARPITLAVGAGRGVCTFFARLSFLFSFFFSWETARYRRKYSLKGPLNPKQHQQQNSLRERSEREREDGVRTSPSFKSHIALSVRYTHYGFAIAYSCD